MENTAPSSQEEHGRPFFALQGKKFRGFLNLEKEWELASAAITL